MILGSEFIDYLGSIIDRAGVINEVISGKQLFILLLAAGLMLIGGLFLSLGYEKTWRIWNIPVKQPVFYDLRLITGGAESYAKGYDPALDNPFDPEQRLFNYPRIWYLILATGIDQSWTVLLGTLLALGFFFSLGVLRGDFDRGTAIIFSLAVFSPAILLGLERANVDLAIFILLAIALNTVDFSKSLSLSILLLGMVFKIFPIFGIGYLVGEDKRSIKYTIIGFLAMAAYMMFTLDDMLHIFADTQKGADVSYGLSVLPTKLSPYLGDHYSTVKLLLYILAGVLILILVYFAFRNQDQLFVKNTSLLNMFRLGAGIYIGTFLLGNNWDYRLMFVLFTIPQLVSWARGRSFSSLLARICLAALLVSCWYLEIWRLTGYVGIVGRLFSFLFDEFANWALFSGLVFLYVKSLPNWLSGLVKGGLFQQLTHKQQEI